MAEELSWHVWLKTTTTEQAHIQTIAKKHGYRRFGDILLEAFREIHKNDISQLNESSFFVDCDPEIVNKNYSGDGVENDPK